MSDHSIALVYFSGTHVTKTYAQVIGDAFTDLGCAVRLFDVTGYESRQKPLPVDDFQALIFGFPVYGDFAPCVINAWLLTLEGKDKPCAQFFTYGARTSGYAHFHTMQLLKQAGFRVLLSAEFLGRHSFNVGGWQILPDRPDEVIEIDKRMKTVYADFQASWHLTEEMMRAKRSKIISESWQAAA